jgi:2-polyprenyl-6-methoxyphenol hydroxylase-like FAD-dependent oxidoreductase
MLPTKTDVVIIGAGPTGIALAIALQQAGVDHVLIERLAEGQTTSRAAVLHAHTLDTLDALGVADDLAARGLRLDRFSIRDRDRALLGLRFGDLASRHSYLLMLPQDDTETVLAERLRALGGRIHRGVTASAVTDTGSGVRVEVTGAGGEAAISARYVVGADGMRSIVRAAAGIEFDGGAYEASFVLADVEMDWPLGRDEVSLFFAPAGLVVVAPLPDGSFRIVATLDDAPETPDRAVIQSILDARGPTSARAEVTEVVWSSRFRVHHRLARTYRRGRMLLMGDAAHVHSPAGGQGMNTGLVDAAVLGRCLADVVLGRRPEAALDRYEELRHPAAEQVLGLAGRLTAMATVRGAPKRLLRNALLSLLDRLPFVKRRLVMDLSGLARSRLAQVG